VYRFSSDSPFNIEDDRSVQNVSDLRRALMDTDFFAGWELGIQVVCVLSVLPTLRSKDLWLLNFAAPKLAANTLMKAFMIANE